MLYKVIISNTTQYMLLQSSVFKVQFIIIIMIIIIICAFFQIFSQFIIYHEKYFPYSNIFQITEFF